MRCPNCGQENRPGARFCSRCRMELLSSVGVTLKPGQTMNNGQYRVVRPLSKGGMGAIYLAANTQAFDRLCVIKEMLAYYKPGEEAEAHQRFEREAKTLAALKHPGIPDMYGYFSEGGHNYIVMEYIEGENLAEGLSSESGEGKPQPLDKVLHYGIQICRVLEYLASIQPEPVVHNDIKPANIIIDKNSGQAVLVDFGTAKARYARDSGGQVGVRQSDTYGTVGYAPPEQYQGRSEPKSDVYALAATMYHLLTDDDPRDHPFQFPRMADIPAELRLVLEKALALDVGERLSATEFRRQLEAVRAAQQGAVQPITFPQGDIATTVTGLLDLSLKHWDYARGILYDGSLDAWLRSSLYNPVAADQAREAVKRYPEEPDAGLDSFLRALNARLPKPQVRAIEREMDFGDVEVGASKKLTLSIVNTSPAGAHGEIITSEPWLRPASSYFGCPPQGRKDLEIYAVNTGMLMPGQRYSGSIVLQPADGTPVTVHARMHVIPPAPTQPLKAPSVRSQPLPKKQAMPQPVAWHTTLNWVRLMALLFIAVAVAAGIYMLARRSFFGSTDYVKGLEALQSGDWKQAQRILANVDPASAEAVSRVGRALDEQMVDIPAGTLVMGRDDGPRDEGPAHEVAMGAYRLGRFEVTNVQYQRFVNATGHRAPKHWPDGHFASGEALYPVVNVTWEDAEAYCVWLSQDLNAQIRLPTEAEWEWAARGEQGYLYPWGNEDRASCRNAGLNAGKLVRVGSYPCGATALGLMDMAGNAREWTKDVYAPYQTSPNPPAAGSRKVIRGGSWRSYNVTATAREHAEASAFFDDLGFRCLQVLP